MSLFLAMFFLILHCPSQSTAVHYCCPIIMQCPRECSYLKKDTAHRSWATNTHRVQAKRRKGKRGHHRNGTVQAEAGGKRTKQQWEGGKERDDVKHKDGIT